MEALAAKTELQLQQWVRTCSCSWPWFLSGRACQHVCKVLLGVCSCWQQSLAVSVILCPRDGSLGAPHAAQGDPVGAPVCWDGVAAPSAILYLPSVFFHDALSRKKVFFFSPGSTWESYETTFLLLVMLTFLQRQVSLIVTVQVLVCNTELALWRYESAQLCKILLAGTALMAWHLVKIWKLKFNFIQFLQLTGQEDVRLSSARGGSGWKSGRS